MMTLSIVSNGPEVQKEESIGNIWQTRKGVFIITCKSVEIHSSRVLYDQLRMLHAIVLALLRMIVIPSLSNTEHVGAGANVRVPR
jgi:hypothetical protein